MSFEGPPAEAYRRVLGDLESRLRAEPGSARLHALKGKVLSVLSRFAEARDALRRSLALEPSRAESRAWLGETFLLENRVAESLKELDEALALDRSCAWARFYRAAALCAVGRVEDAEAESARVSGGGGEPGAAAEALACLLHARAGRFDAALAGIDALAARRRGASWPAQLRAAVERAREERAPAPGKGAAGESAAERLRRRADELLRRGRRAEAEAALRAAGRGSAADPIALYELGHLLEARGAWAAAAAAYRRSCALKPNRLQPYFRLAGLLLSRGKTAELERVLAQAQSASAALKDDSVNVLIGRFQLAVCRRDVEEAARAGEAVLDRTRRLKDLEGLVVPFLPGYDGVPLSPAMRRYSIEALRAASRHAARRPDSPWGLYIQNLWRDRLEPSAEEEELSCRRLAAFPASRYGWMRMKGGCHLLYRGDFSGAIDHLEAARDFSTPPDWRSQCFIAEAHFFAGDLAAALKAFRKAEGYAGAARGEASAWKGAALLWGGRYREALRVLEAIPKGAESPYAGCWKGAALSKLGRHRPALAELDAAIARFPGDWEARVWRAETLLRCGRPRDAAREADAVLAGGLATNQFALAVRGLARAALGDEKGLAKDFAAMPAQLLRSARRALRVPEDGGDRARILEAVLESSRGLRRTDAPWSGRPAPGRAGK